MPYSFAGGACTPRTSGAACSSVSLARSLRSGNEYGLLLRGPCPPRPSASGAARHLRWGFVAAPETLASLNNALCAYAPFGNALGSARLDRFAAFGTKKALTQLRLTKVGRAFLLVPYLANFSSPP